MLNRPLLIAIRCYCSAFVVHICCYTPTQKIMQPHQPGVSQLHVSQMLLPPGTAAIEFLVPPLIGLLGFASPQIRIRSRRGPPYMTRSLVSFAFTACSRHHDLIPSAILALIPSAAPIATCLWFFRSSFRDSYSLRGRRGRSFCWRWNWVERGSQIPEYRWIHLPYVGRGELACSSSAYALQVSDNTRARCWGSWLIRQGARGIEGDLYHPVSFACGQ